MWLKLGSLHQVLARVWGNRTVFCLWVSKMVYSSWKTFWQFLKMLNIHLLFSLMALELLLFWCVYVCVWIFEMALISLQFASLFLLASETKVRYVPLLLSWYIFQFQRRSFFPPCSISLQVVFPLGAVLSTVYLVWKTKKATRGLTAHSRNLGNSGVTKPVQVPDRP